MNFDPYNSELCLAHNAPVRLMSARGVRVICTAGRIWLTVEGEAGDVFLAAGESHLIRGRGQAVPQPDSGPVPFSIERFQQAGRELPRCERQSNDSTAYPCRRPVTLLSGIHNFRE